MVDDGLRRIAACHFLFDDEVRFMMYDSLLKIFMSAVRGRAVWNALVLVSVLLCWVGRCVCAKKDDNETPISAVPRGMREFDEVGDQKNGVPF